MSLFAPESLGELFVRSISCTGLVTSFVISNGVVDVAFVTTTLRDTAVDVNPILYGVYGTVVIGPIGTQHRCRYDGELRFEDGIVTTYQRAEFTAQVASESALGVVDLVVSDNLGVDLSFETHDFGDGPLPTTVVTISVVDDVLLAEAVPPGMRSGSGTPQTPVIKSINSVVPSEDGNITLEFLAIRRFTDMPDVTVTTSTGKIVISDAGEMCK